jgi:hypothetical protein
MAPKKTKDKYRPFGIIPSQLIKILKVAFERGHNMLITGAPGIGKTDIVKQAALESKIALQISHPVVKMQQDYQGMPALTERGAEFVPFGDLRRLLDAKERTVMFLDDIGQARETVQAALMQLVLERRVGEHKIPDCVSFVAATNRREHKAGVRGMLEPLKSRWVSILHLYFDIDDWLTWGYRNNLPKEILSFAKFKPAGIGDGEPTTEFINSPSPRTLNHVAEILKADYPDKLRHKMIIGAAGDAFAVEFKAFYGLYKHLPDVDKLIAMPDSFKMPTDDKGKVRQNVMYALTGSIVSKASDANMDKILKLTAKMPKEWQAKTLLDIPKRLPSARMHGGLQKWFLDNKQSFI